MQGNAPLPFHMLIVPRERFAEAAKILKKGYALLAAEWAADETPYGQGIRRVCLLSKGI